MKLALVSMIRNEQDILNVFLNHIDTLFDEVHLIDHRSIDSTGEILRAASRQREGWTYIKLEINGFFQEETTLLSMRQLFERGADCVFFLDCDEFIQIINREDLEKITEGVNNSQVAGSLRWFNCVPNSIERSQFHHESCIWKFFEPSHLSKVLIPRSIYERYKGNISLTHGNHLVLDGDGNELNTLEVGTLIHLPVRSRNQLIQKAIVSALPTILRSTRKPGEGFHYNEMMNIFTNGEPSDDVVRGCVNLYQHVSKILPISKMDLTNGLYQKTSLKKLGVATTQEFSFEIAPNKTHLIERMIADQILSYGEEDPGNLVYDENEGRIFIKR
jgi:hypothetical protein